MTGPDTIFALSSAPGRAGVAIIRVSGPSAGDCLKILAGSIPLARTAALRSICKPPHGGQPAELIDKGLVLWFPAPKSFTGEDCCEFQVHGGRAVISAVLHSLQLVSGCREAEPGEFARRAFENGKLDLTAAEGLVDLIDAQTEAQRQQAVAQAGGALAQLYEGWRHKLIEALALQEALIDFSDEADVARSVGLSVGKIVSQLLIVVRQHLADANRGEILREGFQVILAGPPNAGKSSLLNALARRDAAIVSDEPGTTRDVIDVRLDLDGLPVVISDTAGIRDDASGIELEGINRTRSRIRNADLVVWLHDYTSCSTIDQTNRAQSQSVALDDGIAHSIVRLDIYSKCDLLSGDRLESIPKGGLMISAHTKQGLSEFSHRLVAIARDKIGSMVTPAPTRQRHRTQLEQCIFALETYDSGISDDVELRAEDLRLAAMALGRITGMVDPEDVLDRIFSTFCIGK